MEFTFLQFFSSSSILIIPNIFQTILYNLNIFYYFLLIFLGLAQYKILNASITKDELILLKSILVNDKQKANKLLILIIDEVLKLLDLMISMKYKNKYCIHIFDI